MWASPVCRDNLGGAVALDRQLTYERCRACNFDPNAEYLYALTLR